MIFDLQGKRRRLVQGIYALLAVLMGGSLILFGVGGSSAGGLLDGLGVGGHGGGGGGHGGGGGGGADIGDRVDRIEERLDDNPQNARLLLELVRARYQAGVAAGEGGGHGDQPELTDDSLEHFREATAAWERYLARRPRPPSVSGARLVTQAYVGLNDFPGAVTAQEVIARRTPSPGVLGTLATYRYAAGDFKGGDGDVRRAVALSRPAARPALRRRLATLKRQIRDAVRESREAAQSGAEHGLGLSP